MSDTLHRGVDAAATAFAAQETVRLAIKGVVSLTALSVVGSVALLMMGKTAPDGLVAVAAGGVGALATMLSSVIRTS